MSDLTPRRYRRGSVKPSGSCEVCAGDGRLHVDHCHRHGWIRGTLCQICNHYMGWLDAGKPFTCPEPSLILRTVLFVEHWRKCHECAAGQSAVPVFADYRVHRVEDMCVDHILLRGEITVLQHRLSTGLTDASDVRKAAELLAKNCRIGSGCNCLPWPVRTKRHAAMGLSSSNI